MSAIAYHPTVEALARDIVAYGEHVALSGEQLAHWARELQRLGFETKKMIAAQFLVLAGALESRLGERATLAVLQLAALVRYILGQPSALAAVLERSTHHRSAAARAIGSVPSSGNDAPQGVTVNLMQLLTSR